MPFDEIMNETTDFLVSGAVGEVFCKSGNKKEDKALAMVYSPYQHWEDLFSEEEALKRGTLFAKLYKPYCGGNRAR